MFCPSCHSEYRPGFTRCASCDVDLVENLVVETIEPEEMGETLPVGLVSSTELGRPVEIDGKVYDLMRVFPLELANEAQQRLADAGFPVVIAPIDADFPDQRPRFEVRVRAREHEAAEAALKAAFQAQVDQEGTGGDATSETSVDTCPACGAHVPLDATECPDCGLFVGAAGDDEDDDDDDGDEAEGAEA